MRIYKNFIEAQNEIGRDLAELGMRVQPETMQQFYVADRPEFETKELANYAYTVTKPDYLELEGVHEDWVHREWRDRLAGDLNPGTAWKKREEVWRPLLEVDKPEGHIARFTYTYSQRMGGQHIQSILEELKRHPHSRQLYLSVWDRISDPKNRGYKRVPCSLGYWFVMRNDEIHITYMMRSCDLFTHFPNDVAMATILQAHVAKESGYGIGSFTHFIGSLHAYRKDMEGIF